MSSPIILINRKKKQRRVSRFMDYLSAPLSQPLTTLSKGWGAGARAVKKSRKRIRAGKESGWGAIGTTLATTAVIGTGVVAAGGGVAGLAVRRGALIAGKALMPKTIKSGAGMLLGAGILASSAKARSALLHAPKTIYKSGKKLGEIYEEPGKARDILGIKKEMTTKEKIIAGGKSAGKYGAIIAGGLALGTLAKKTGVIKKGIEYFKKKKETKLGGTHDVGAIEARPYGLIGAPLESIPKTIAVSPAGARGASSLPHPINNIIQISVR